MTQIFKKKSKFFRSSQASQHTLKRGAFLKANPKEVWAERGAPKLMGDNIKVVLAEFSFLS
jgi:hypothetical protein